MPRHTKHILIFNRSFWPDMEATGQLLTELCEELVKVYKITIISGCSYYLKEKTPKSFGLYHKETFKDIDILRVQHTRFWKVSLLGRIINWCTYSILAFLVALNLKPQVIIACTDPPFLGIIAMLLSRLKSVPFIYNCRDLFPDVGWALGKLKKSNFLSQAFDCFNKKAFGAASLVICLGQSMKNRIVAKRIPDECLKVIPDWVDTAKIRPVPKKDNPLLAKLGLVDKFILMHSGNLGLSQNLSLLLQAVIKVRNPSSFYLVFLGEGAAKQGLKQEARSLGLNNVLFLPYQPKEMLSFSLGMADLHIVSLKKGMAGIIVPSKVYGIMAAGRPYLSITDAESEPASLVREYGCGLWVAPDNAEEVAESIEWAMAHPVDLEEMGRRSRHLAETQLDKHIVINQWFKILNEKVI